MANDVLAPFRVRRITYNHSERGVVMQSQNGPCPLIAIANLLSLRGQADLSSINAITAHQLCNLVGEIIMTTSNDADDDAVTDIILKQLPTLVRGLDVNVRFDSIVSFEKTAEMNVFDRLGIVLVHGWLADPADAPVYDAVAHLYYNELVVKAVRTPKRSLVDENFKDDLIRDYLQETLSQLTPTGLDALHSVQVDEPCILFRNNHFSTLIRRDDAIFLLVTDESFMDMKDIVWEKLDSVTGATAFVDAAFRPVSFADEFSFLEARRRSSLYVTKGDNEEPPQSGLPGCISQ